MSVNDRARHGSSRVVFEEHSVLGFNYRMTDVQAAVGREQLRRLPGLVAARRRIAERYSALLGELDGVVAPSEPAYARSNWQSYSVQLPEWSDQRGVMQCMLDRGVATRRGIMCAHREAPYAGTHDLPVSEWAQDRHVLLPMYPELSDGDVERVVTALSEAIGAS